MLLSCPEFCQYLDDPRGTTENCETANILRNILREIRNFSNGSVVNITKYVSPLRIKYEGNAHIGGDTRRFIMNIMNDLTQGSDIFNNYYKHDICYADVPSNQINLNYDNFNQIWTRAFILNDNTNFRSAFLDVIRTDAEDCTAKRSDGTFTPVHFDARHNVYGKNIFIHLERTNDTFTCEIPRYLEFNDHNENPKRYKLVSANCNRPGHATACIMTDDEKIVHIDDRIISVYDFEDAQSELLSGRGRFHARLLNYREV